MLLFARMLYRRVRYNHRQTMNELFKQTTSIIEREFYDSEFLAEQWQDLKNIHAQQYKQAESVEEKETVLKSLLESLGVSHSMLIDPQLVECIVQQEETPEKKHRRTYAHKRIGMEGFSSCCRI